MDAEYPGASDYVQAAWFGERDMPIDTIVIHITDGQGDASKTADYFSSANRQVSAHFVVGQDGTVIQCVPISKRAYHAHNVNSRSIGIEHCARTESEFRRTGTGEVIPLTVDQLRASASLVRWLCDNYGIPIDRAHIIGHKQVDQSTNHDDCPEGITDPDGNIGWPWDSYLAMVADTNLNQRPIVALLDLAFGLIGTAISAVTGA